MRAATRTAARATKSARESDQGGRMAPWFLPVALMGVGHLSHTQLATSPLSAALAGAFIALSGVALTTTTWLYARPRGPLVQWHASATSALVALQLLGLMALGLSWPVFWIVLGLSWTLAATWTVRRLPAVRGEGDGQSDPAQSFGLSVKRRKVIVDSADRAEVKLTLGDGQTVDDLQKVLPAIGSTFGTLRKGARATAGAREGEATLSLSYRDVLAETLPWPGPSHPGGSIADGWRHGLAEDSREVWTYPAGNYAKNIAPGHTGLSGMPRSGKGACAHVVIGETCTRRDVAKLLLVDTRKGAQFTAPIEAAIGWYADDELKAKALLAAVERAVVARNKALGSAGYSSWTPAAYDDPGLRMPYLIVWLEEAAAYLDLFVRLLVGLGEASLSAGVELVLSAQLWKHDRVPTSLRSSIGNVLVFGQASTEDAAYLLSDETISTGVDPGAWKTRHPGRFLCEGNGIDPERFAVPAKHFLADKGLLSQVTNTYGSMMAPYDKVTLTAFGDAFVPYGGGARDELERVTDRMKELADDDELPEERMGMYAMPEMEEKDLAAMMRDIDPRAEDSGAVPDVDLRGEPGARTWTREEKEEEFRQMLLWFQGQGKHTVRTSDLHTEWRKRVGDDEAARTWFVHELLNAWIDTGQMERMTDADGDVLRGWYRIGTLVNVDSASTRSE